MRADTFQRIRPLLRPREGVVSQAELVAAGLDSALASREVRAGRWARLLPGVYLTSREPASLWQRCHAAQLYAGSEAVISGAAGCALRKLTTGRDDPGQVRVLVPVGQRHVSSGFVTVVRPRTLPSSQFLRREGCADLTVALPERCAEDAIREAEQLGDARAVACALLRSRQIDWPTVARAASRRGPGTGHLARVVRDVADGVRSPAEGELHDTLRSAARRGQLPPYLLNPVIYLDGRLLGSPDAYFPGFGLGDEQDSRQWHGGVDELDATLRRHDTFQSAGLRLNHTTPSRFQGDPRGHVAKLVSLLAERAELATPEPAGLLVLGRGPLLPARTPWPQVADPFR